MSERRASTDPSSWGPVAYRKTVLVPGLSLIAFGVLWSAFHFGGYQGSTVAWFFAVGMPLVFAAFSFAGTCAVFSVRHMYGLFGAFGRKLEWLDAKFEVVIPYMTLAAGIVSFVTLSVKRPGGAPIVGSAVSACGAIALGAERVRSKRARGSPDLRKPEGEPSA